MKNKTLKSLLMITFLAGTVTLVGCNNDNQTSQAPATDTNTIDVEAELNTKKEQAIKEVEKYKNLNDYRQNEQNELNKFITEAKNSINKATSVNEIETIVNNFKTNADNLKTNADYEKEELKYLFPEFREYEGMCRFNGCDHVHEPGCAVKEALEEGKIHKIRYQNYIEMYEELKNKRRY